MITPAMFKMLLPLACKWAEAQESVILRKGVPLNSSQLQDARKIGIKAPECVRLHAVEEIPMPEDPLLHAAALETGLISPFTIGLTLRYGIFIKNEQWGDRRLVVHELTHTAQYERLGGFEGFLSAYLEECVKVGYPHGPLEQEAKRMERQIIKA